MLLNMDCQKFHHHNLNLGTLIEIDFITGPNVTEVSFVMSIHSLGALYSYFCLSLMLEGGKEQVEEEERERRRGRRGR